MVEFCLLPFLKAAKITNSALLWCVNKYQEVNLQKKTQSRVKCLWWNEVIMSSKLKLCVDIGPGVKKKQSAWF